jgi:hypothetical protein
MTPRYQAFVFVPPGVEVSMPTLAATAAPKFVITRGQVEPRGSTIRVAFPGFLLQATLVDADYVLEESQEIAERLADKEAAARIAVCERRVEVFSTGDDDDMEHFNDYLLLVAAVQRALPGSVAWDPGANEVI